MQGRTPVRPAAAMVLLAALVLVVMASAGLIPAVVAAVAVAILPLV